jgi:drug/metabolite transporter (DMT)-like permease
MEKTTRQDVQLGMLLIVCGAALFAIMDGIGKSLSSSLTVGQVVWGRYFFHTVLVFLILSRGRSFGFLRTSMPMMQFLRAGAMFASTLFMYMALRVVPLADATAVQFLSAAIVTLLSAVLLGEHVGWHRITAVLVGFCAVMLIIRPGFRAAGGHLFLPLLTAVFVAFYMILTRRLREFDPEKTTFFYSTLVGTVVLTVALPWQWSATSPVDWVLSVAMGALGAGGHFLVVKAFHKAPASLLSPFLYSQLIVATAISVVWFGDIPDIWMAVGSAIVVGSGLYVWWRERYLGKMAPGLATEAPVVIGAHGPGSFDDPLLNRWQDTD